MNRWIRMYWAGRLGNGKIFHFPTLVSKDYDYKVKDGDSWHWPPLVAKEALYLDYLAWAENRPGASVPMSDWYRQMEPFLYPYGKAAQTRRSNVRKHIYVQGRMVEGKVMRAFIRMPSLEVMTAHYNLHTLRGGLSERAAWRKIVEQGAVQMGLSVAEVPQG